MSDGIRDIGFKVQILRSQVLFNSASALATAIGVFVEQLLPSSQKSRGLHSQEPCFGNALIVFEDPEVDFESVVGLVIESVDVVEGDDSFGVAVYVLEAEGEVRVGGAEVAEEAVFEEEEKASVVEEALV